MDPPFYGLLQEQSLYSNLVCYRETNLNTESSSYIARCNDMLVLVDNCLLFRRNLELHHLQTLEWLHRLPFLSLKLRRSHHELRRRHVQLVRILHQSKSQISYKTIHCLSILSQKNVTYQYSTKQLFWRLRNQNLKVIDRLVLLIPQQQLLPS